MGHPTTSPPAVPPSFSSTTSSSRAKGRPSPSSTPPPARCCARCPKPRPSRCSARSRPRAAPTRAGRRPRRRSAPALLLKLAALIEANAESFARLESLNCGKPYARALGDEIPAIADCFRYFAGAARCMNGSISRRVPRGPHQHDPARPHRRGRLDRALELPADDGGVEDRARAGRRQYRRAQAQRADAADGAAVRAPGGATSCPRACSTWSAGAAPASASRWWSMPQVRMVSVTGDVSTGRKILQAAVRHAQAHASGARRQGAR